MAFRSGPANDLSITHLDTWTARVKKKLTDCSAPLTSGSNGSNEAKDVFLHVEHIPTGASTTVTPNSTLILTNVIEDTRSIYNTTTGVATIPQDGLYEVKFRCLLSFSHLPTVVAPLLQSVISITHNNTISIDTTFQTRDLGFDTNTQVQLDASKIVRCVSGDTLHIIPFTQNGPTSVNTVYEGTAQSNLFQVYYLGKG